MGGTESTILSLSSPKVSKPIEPERSHPVKMADRINDISFSLMKHSTFIPFIKNVKTFLLSLILCLEIDSLIDRNDVKNNAWIFVIF